MSWQLRIILVIVCILVCAFTLRKIKKAQMQIEDSLFWIVMSFALVILSIFPGIAEMLSKVLGIESTVNCVFLIMIFIMFLKIFMLSANSHFLRPAGPHFPANQGHIKRSALEIGRARGTPPC